MPGCQDFGPILVRLGPHRMGKGCLYIRHLDQVNDAVLRELIAAGLEGLRKLWPVTSDQAPNWTFSACHDRERDRRRRT